MAESLHFDGSCITENGFSKELMAAILRPLPPDAKARFRLPTNLVGTRSTASERAVDARDSGRGGTRPCPESVHGPNACAERMEAFPARDEVKIEGRIPNDE